MNRRDFLKTSGLLSTALSLRAVSATQQENVLVLGGTGFFGPVLVKELIAQGYSVTLLNRGKTNPHLFPELPRIIADRETPDGSGLVALRDNSQHWDWVVDTWQGSSKAVEDSANILSNRTEHYQYVSTVSVYDKWDDIGINEDEPLNPLPGEREAIISSNRYALRKTFSELALRRIMPEKSVFFRSHGMRGYPTSAPKHEPYWQVKIKKGGDLVVPSDIHYYQITDMVSLARFMIHCGQNQLTGPYNVAYPPLVFKQFIQTIVNETNSHVRLHWIPQAFLLKHGVQLIRETPIGRYRFSVERALNSGLVNRPIEALISDQLHGYLDRNPKDDFEFGQPDTSTISVQKELDVIRLWQTQQAKIDHA